MQNLFLVKIFFLLFIILIISAEKICKKTFSSKSRKNVGLTLILFTAFFLFSWLRRLSRQKVECGMRFYLEISSLKRLVKEMTRSPTDR